MKKAFDVLSLLGVLSGLVWLAIAGSPSDQPPPVVTSSVARFAGFPVNQPRTVQIDWGDLAQQSATNRQRNDQILDWLMLTVAAGAGLDPQKLNDAMWDLPPVRDGATEQVADFEYGETRSRDIGDGEIIALLPADSPEKAELLARVADEQRNNTGRRPKLLQVFEYELSPSVTIVRREAVDGQTLFAPPSGYHEQLVRDRSGLQEFLNEVDDLTFAELSTDGLFLGGRRIPGGYRGINLEDAGALWQSQAQIEETRSEIEAFDRKWRSMTAHSFLEESQLEAQAEAEKKQLEKKIGHNATDHSGFSLDPAYDFEGLSKMFDFFTSKVSGIPTAQVLKVQASLRDRDIGPLYSLFQQLATDPASPFLASIRDSDRSALESLPQDERISRLTSMLNGFIRRSTFQAARYDGSLQGTQVGMTLFYTDLLAKLKALDFWRSHDVTDFQSLTEVRLSPVYKAESEKLSRTRLWFGPQSKGFQLTAANLIFSRTATRVYAASSSTFEPGKEVEPNAESAQFLGWWNDHYEEIAQAEPQYQRLNEIMKWSLLVGWLYQKKQANTLGFLGQEKVDRNNWFPDWAKTNRSLRYQDWNLVQFFPNGYKGTTTEALPMLKSAEFEEFGDTGNTLSGGVSLGDTNVIAGRPVLTESFSNELRLKAGLDLSAEANQSENTIQTLDKVTHVFREEIGGVETVSTARSEAKFRSLFGDMRNVPVTREYSASPSKMEIAVGVGENKLGAFHSDFSGSEIRVGFRALDIDEGQALAEDLSSAAAKHEDLDAVLKNNPRVQFAVKMDCEGCFAIKLRGSQGWLKLAPEQSPALEIASGWDARVAALDRDAQNYNLAWIDEQKLGNELSDSGYVRIHMNPAGPRDFPIEISNRGPPADARDIQLSLYGTKVSAHQTTDGVVYVARGQIPSDLLSHPQNLAAAIFSPTEDPLLRDLRTQDYDAALRKIAADPASAKKHLDELAASWSAGADKSLVAGNDATAAQELTDLMNLRGATPDLSARRAIADLQSPDVAVQAIQESLKTPVRDADSLFDIINNRLRRPGITAGESYDLNQFAKMTDFRLLQARSGLGGEIRPLVEDGRIAFHYRLSEQVQGTHVSVQEAGIDGPIYVLDRPSMNFLDWQVPVTITHPEAVSAEIVQLPRWDLAQISPDVIETPKGNYRLTNYLGRAAYQRAGVRNDQGCPDAEQDSTRCNRFPYLVTPSGSG
jgi:hypothetical protein